MSNLPLYEKIFRVFEEKILTNELKADEKLPTEMEISEKHQVSRITATRALKELELRDLIYRIKGSGSYVKNQNVKIKVNKKPMGHLSIISLVLPFGDNFSSAIFEGIENVAKEENYFVTFHNSNDDPIIERKLIEEIIARGSHGLIVYPSSSTKNMHLYSSLLIDHYPFVLIDRNIHGIEAPLVWTDHLNGFYDITSKLLTDGHKKIIFVGTSLYTISSEAERYKGFCKAHIDSGTPLMENHLYTEANINDIPDDFYPEKTIFDREAHFLFDKLMMLDEDKRPTAIAAVHDEVAEVLIRVAIEKGIRIPEDFSITGFDNLAFSAHLPVPLTTVAQPAELIGTEAAKELFMIITEPERKPISKVIEGKLVIRQSTGKI